LSLAVFIVVKLIYSISTVYDNGLTSPSSVVITILLNVILMSVSLSTGLTYIVPRYKSNGTTAEERGEFE